jgi:hypothetical protein
VTSTSPTAQSRVSPRLQSRDKRVLHELDLAFGIGVGAREATAAGLSPVRTRNLRHVVAQPATPQTLQNLVQVPRVMRGLFLTLRRPVDQ